MAHTSDLSDSTLGSPKINRQVLLMSRPQGIPQSQNFEIVQSALPQIGPGQVLVRNTYLSVEPAVRSWVSQPAQYH